MLKSDVFTEQNTADGNGCEAVAVPTWLDVSEVFAVRADRDAEWSIITFRPGAGPRTLVVRGKADAVAAVITADRRRDWAS